MYIRITYIYVYIYVYICTYIYIYTHTHIPFQARRWRASAPSAAWYAKKKSERRPAAKSLLIHVTVTHFTTDFATLLRNSLTFY